jgi:hypothetical protein
MKKFFAFVLGAAAVFQMTSCSTKINVAAPYKNITVVYGLMDMADTAHYVRIEKAFMSQNLSAATMAANPDSLYFSTLNVTMKAVNSLGNIDATYTLTRVNMTQEGYPKGTGDFATDPNYGYKFKATLNPEDTYWLIISNPATGEVDSAESPVINDLNHSVFPIAYYDNPNLSDLNEGIDFERLGLNNPDLTFTPAVSGIYTPVASTDSVPAIYQAVFRLRWENISASGTISHDSADMALQESTNVPLPGYSFNASNLSMYQFILNSLGKAGTGESRKLDSCDLFVYAGSQTLANYQQISQSVGTGLTANEIEPTFTNIQGKNVLGIFTGRGTRTQRIRISQYTMDSIVNSSQAQTGYLSGTNIVGTTY